MTQKYPRITSQRDDGGAGPGHCRQPRAAVSEYQIGVALGPATPSHSDDPLLSLSDRERVPEPYAHDDSLLMESLVELGGFPVSTDFVDLWADGMTPNPTTGVFFTCTVSIPMACIRPRRGA